MSNSSNPKVTALVCIERRKDGVMPVDLQFKFDRGPVNSSVDLLLVHVSSYIIGNILKVGGYGRIHFIYDPLEGIALDLREFRVEMLSFEERELIQHNAYAFEMNGLLDTINAKPLPIELVMSFVIKEQK